MNDNGQRSAKLQFIISMVIFGTIGIFVRFLPYSSSMIAMIRGIIGALFLLVFIVVRGKRLNLKAIKSNLLILVLTGACIGVNWILLFESYRYTTVATATLCYYFAPVFVIIASPFVFNEKINTVKAMAVVMSLIGMVLVSGVYNGIGKPDAATSENSLGITLGIGAALFYAAVIILNKKLKDIEAYDQTIVQLFTAGAVLIPYNIVTGAFKDVALETSPAVLILIAIVCIVHTGIAYVLYFGSMQTLSAQTIAIFSYIDPVVAILVSTFLLKENMDMLGVFGAVLILGSTLMSELRSQKQL